MLFTGSYTALLTPFRNGEVDYDAYRKLVDFQIDNGTFLGQQREGDPVPIKKLFAYFTNSLN